MKSDANFSGFFVPQENADNFFAKRKVKEIECEISIYRERSQT